MTASQSVLSSPHAHEGERPPSFINALIGFVLTTALTSALMMLLGQL